MKAHFAIGLFLALAVSPGRAEQPLLPDARIDLGEVAGTVGPLAIDLSRGRLFAALPTRDSSAVIDLASRRLIGRIGGLPPVSALAFTAKEDALFVAGGGSVQRLRGSDLARTKVVAFDRMPGALAIDQQAGYVFAGSGPALSILSAGTGRHLIDVALPGLPQAIALEEQGSRLYVGMPSPGLIAVGDRASRSKVGQWALEGLPDIVSLALDEPRRRLLVAQNHPAVLSAYAADRGSLDGRIASCEQPGSLSRDVLRRRFYLACGDGFIMTVLDGPSGVSEIGRLPTAPGTRHALFVPELDRLFIGGPEGVTILRPVGPGAEIPTARR
jgi:hypothetical protein